MIIFLTDGEATQGVTDNEQIRQNVVEANKNMKIPIYGLAFGNGADFNLIKAIGTESGAFSRRIYEASDAAIQLEDFYSEISSPLLNNVTFDYVGEAFKNKSSTRMKTFFKGGEYIVAGKLDIDDGNNEIIREEIEIVVLAEGSSARYNEKIRPCDPVPIPRNSSVQPLPGFDLSDQSNIHSSGMLNGTESFDMVSIHRPPCIPWPHPPHVPPTNNTPQEERSDSQNFLERLWAYLTIENLLDEKVSETEMEKMILLGENITKEALANKTKFDEAKALQLALDYNFVTKLTSLVVVKPEDDSNQNNVTSNGTIVNPIPVEEIARQPMYYPSSRMRSFGGYGSYQSGVIPRSRMGRVQSRGSMRRYSSNKKSNSFGGYSGGWHVQSAGLPGPPPQMNKMALGPPGFNSGSIQTRLMSSSYDYDDDDDYDTLADLTFPSINNRMRHYPTSTTLPVLTSTSKPKDCEINLFPKTYLRGLKVTISSQLNSTVSDLSLYSFDDKLKSLEVKGPCCWEIFADKNFLGDRKRFNTGEYKSSTMIGADLVREASSLKISVC